LGVKNYLKYIFEQVGLHKCSKLSACLISIQNGTVIIFLIPVVLVDFTSHKEGVLAKLYCECEDVGGGDL